MVMVGTPERPPGPVPGGVAPSRAPDQSRWIGRATGCRPADGACDGEPVDAARERTRAPNAERGLSPGGAFAPPAGALWTLTRRYDGATPHGQCLPARGAAPWALSRRSRARKRRAELARVAGSCGAERAARRARRDGSASDRSRHDRVLHAGVTAALVRPGRPPGRPIESSGLRIKKGEPPRLPRAAPVPRPTR